MRNTGEMPALSVVVPAYNEARRILPTLDRIGAYLDGRGESYELIVVDDGSRDATVEVTRAAAATRPSLRVLPQPRNLGKGAAVRAGVLASRGREVLFSDADLSTPIEEIERLRAALDGGADVAIGSRAVAGDVERHQTWFRRVQGRCFHLAVRGLGFRSVTAIRDTQCGFKLFRGPVARALFADLTLTGFSFDVELLELAWARFRIAEIAVAWTHADGSKVRPGIDAAKMLGDLVKLRWSWLRRGRPALALPAAGTPGMR